MGPRAARVEGRGAGRGSARGSGRGNRRDGRWGADTIAGLRVGHTDGTIAFSQPLAATKAVVGRARDPKLEPVIARVVIVPLDPKVAVAGKTCAALSRTRTAAAAGTRSGAAVEPAVAGSEPVGRPKRLPS